MAAPVPPGSRISLLHRLRQPLGGKVMIAASLLVERARKLANGKRLR